MYAGTTKCCYVSVCWCKCANSAHRSTALKAQRDRSGVQFPVPGKVVCLCGLCVVVCFELLVVLLLAFAVCLSLVVCCCCVLVCVVGLFCSCM